MKWAKIEIERVRQSKKGDRCSVSVRERENGRERVRDERERRMREQSDR